MIAASDMVVRVKQADIIIITIIIIMYGGMDSAPP